VPTASRSPLQVCGTSGKFLARASPQAPRRSRILEVRRTGPRRFYNTPIAVALPLLAGWIVFLSAVAAARPTAATGAPATPATEPPPAPPESTAKQPPAAAPSHAAATPRGYRRLEDRLTLREPFNQAAKKIRIVAFLSPTCPRCLANAGQLQREVMEKNPQKEIAVFIVWLKVLDTDNEDAVVAAMKRVPDPRAHHYWDPQRVLNAQLLDAIMFDVNVRLYDVFLLYDAEARWEKRLPRPGYWMHEFQGAPGPHWDVSTFAAEVQKGLRGQPFSVPYQ
jgi:hypothetical protein